MHYYQKNIGDYAKKTGHLTALEHGVYNLIMDGYYDRERGPTLVEATRWARARTEEEKSAVLAVLDEFFVLVGEEYTHAHIIEEIALYKAKAEIAQNNGKKGGRPPKNNPEKPSGLSVGSNPVPVSFPVGTQVKPDGNPEKTGSQANHKPVTTNHKPEKSRGTRLPEGWHPTEDDTAFCKQNRPDLRPSEVARSFYDYWIAVPGVKGCKLNWSATWRNWVMKETARPGTASTGDKFRVNDLDHSSTSAAMIASMEKHGIVISDNDDPIEF